MILILEGCNGVGKSKHAVAWAKRMGAPILRAFRPNPDFHFNGATSLEKELVGLDVPVNTYVDDLYIADTLGAILRARPEFNAVLDRSMPSALAYGQELQAVARPGSLMAIWQRLLGRTRDVKYVWMVCPYSMAAQRVSERGDRPPTQEQYEALERSFHTTYEMVILPKTIIDTGQLDFEETAARLVE